MAEDAEGFARLALAALDRRRPRDALDWADRAVAADPALAPAHVLRARALHRLGEATEAIRALCRAVALDPDTPTALDRLRWSLEDGRTRTAAALDRIAARGLAVGTVLDVGASDGRWSLDARTRWPAARVHLVEAFDHWAAALDRLCAEEPGFSHVLAAAGDREGEAWLRTDPADPFAGGTFDAPVDGARRVPRVTLAGEVRRLALPPPYLIKLDVHGAEVPILEGAAPLLPDTALVVIEAYAFRIRPGALLFDETCAHMAARGFRAIDLADPMWRPRDGALWQMDLFFVRADRPEFAVGGF